MTNGHGEGQEGETERPTPDQGGESDREEVSLPGPTPDYSPERVIKTVLKALRDNDDPHDDAGIRTAFNFASPLYRKQVGGSLEEFAKQMTDPIHQALIDHRETERGRLDYEDGEAEEKVVVTDEDGDKTTYEFSLSKQSRGKYERCWMIEGVELVYVGESPDHQHMPVVEFDGEEVKCREGDILRDALLRASGISPYNDKAQYANCNGKGLCGTCAVEIIGGEVTEKTSQEKRRLKLPPHRGNDNPDFRLSCQCRVLEDLKVHKHEGTWGQHIDEVTSDEAVEEGDPIRVSDEEYLGGGETEAVEAVEEDGEDLELSEEAQNMLAESGDILDDEDDED